MGARGAEFSEVAPKGLTTGRLRNEFFTLESFADGIEGGRIQQVSPLNSFRIGQQVFFWLGVTNPVAGDGQTFGFNWMTRLRLKPWWLRPNLEYRAAGDPAYVGIDQQTFGSGPFGANQVNNRYVWIPSEKRLDVTQFATVTPPPVALPRTSDSLMLDDVIAMDLQDPTDATYIANFSGDGQVVSRWMSFMYPAHGYALGFTYERELENTPGQGQPPAATPSLPEISITWKIGTLGGTVIQESIG